MITFINVLWNTNINFFIKGVSDENAVETPQQSQLANSDVATNLRNIRAADPGKRAKNNNKPDQEKKKKKLKKGKNEQEKGAWR